MSASERSLRRLAGPTLGLGTFVILAAVVLAALGILRSIPNQAPDAGCGGVAEGEIVESDVFTPYEDMRSRLSPAALNPAGVETPDVPSDARLPSGVVDGLPLRWAVVGHGSVYQYFSEKPVSADLTREEFMSGGGIELDRDVSVDTEGFATYLLETVRSRAVRVQVGNYVGALTWADPDVNGTRTHDLYWSDGPFDYALTANRTAAQIVNLGRTIAC